MKKIQKSLVVIIIVLATFLGSEVLAAVPEGAELSSPPEAYHFQLQGYSIRSLKVQFAGNKMYHNDKYLGFGVSGKPMLAIRYLAQSFDFQVDYDANTKSCLVSKGEYGFRLAPDSKLIEINWAGQKVKEMELTESPILRNNVLYLYSLDISELLGLITNWDNTARTWEVTYKEYRYQDYGFPTQISDDTLVIKWLLLDDNALIMPQIAITDVANKVQARFSSGSYLGPSIDSQHKYQMECSVALSQEVNQLQVSLTIGQRIINSEKIVVARNLEKKELIVEAPYSLEAPTQGYVKMFSPKLLTKGSVSSINNYCPPEIALFVRKADSDDILFQDKIPIIEGKFEYELELKSGTGLYRITLNSIMAAPRGTAYPEITDFYVEYQEKQ